MALNLSLGLEKWLPFQNYAEAEKMADAALSAKTHTADVRGSHASPCRGVSAPLAAPPGAV